MMSRAYKFPGTKTTRMLCIALSCSLLLSLAVGCSNGAPPEPVASDPIEPVGKAIVWGKVDLQPTDAINEWQPMVNYLAANLGEVGIEVGKMKIAPDSETLGQWMAAGEVDLIRDSFYPAMIVSDISGARPIVFRMTGKDPKHAVFFTRADNSINSLSGFEGNVIAFAERDSTSGFMLPMAYLLEQGFEAVEIPSADAAVPQGQIGYVFAGDDDVVATWVLSGRVIAGVVDNGTYEEFVEQNPGELAIVAETSPISSNNPVLVRNDLDPAVTEAIKKVLMEMTNTQEGREILESTDTLGFSEISETASADWSRTEEWYQQLFSKD